MSSTSSCLLLSSPRTVPASVIGGLIQTNLLLLSRRLQRNYKRECDPRSFTPIISHYYFVTACPCLPPFLSTTSAAPSSLPWHGQPTRITRKGVDILLSSFVRSSVLSYSGQLQASCQLYSSISPFAPRVIHGTPSAQPIPKTVRIS